MTDERVRVNVEKILARTSRAKVVSSSRGSLTLWQKAVTQKDGERMVVPRAKIGVLTASSLWVEPYKQSFRVIAHELGSFFLAEEGAERTLVSEADEGTGLY